MAIISNFPSGGGSGGGIALAPVSNIDTVTSAGKVYVKWTDPADIVLDGLTLAAWAGTLLVRKAGAVPASRRDGVIVLDSKERNGYQSVYFCDSGLTDGVEYFYKLFPYTASGAYTDDEACEFSATPEAVPVGDVSDIAIASGGNGKLSITWSDPAATVTEKGITVASWFSTKVVVKAGSYAESPDDPDAAYAYTSTTRNGHASSALIASGLENGTEYYVSFFPVTSDGAVNANDVNRGTGTPNRFPVSAVPSQSESLTYNGSAQSPSWSDYDAEKMTLEGTTSQTNAGSYSVTFTLHDDYQWPDGTTGAKEVTWEIRKYYGRLELSPSRVNLDYENVSKTITVTRPGNGAVSVSFNKDGCVSVSVSNPTGESPTITVTGIKNGSATLQVKLEETENYGSGNRIFPVNVSDLPTDILNDNSWATISAVSAKSQGPNYWSVGDCKAVLVKGTVGTLSIDQTLWVYILGFDHNSALEGKGITFGCFKTAQSGGVDVALVDGKYNMDIFDGTKYFNINHWGFDSSPYNTNYGGWKGCDSRYDILGSTKTAPSGYGSIPTTSRVGYDAPADTATNPVVNTLMAALPSDLRAESSGLSRCVATRFAEVVHLAKG